MNKTEQIESFIEILICVVQVFAAKTPQDLFPHAIQIAGNSEYKNLYLNLSIRNDFLEEVIYRSQFESR